MTTTFTTDNNYGKPAEGDKNAGNTINQDLTLIDGGRTFKASMGEDATQGQVMYLASDSKWYKAKADTLATSKWVGFLKDSKVTDEDGFARVSGRITVPGASFTAGEICYLSTSTAGEVIQAKPDEPYYAVPLGVAYDATTIFILRDFAPDQMGGIGDDHDQLDNLAWDVAGHTFNINVDLNNYALYNVSGIYGGVVDSTAWLKYEDISINTTTDYYGAYIKFLKTAGATDPSDDMIAIYGQAGMSDGDSTIGNLFGIYGYALHADGTINTAVAGLKAVAQIEDNADTVYGYSGLVDFNAGTVTNIIGGFVSLDMEVGAVTTDAYGFYIDADLDGTISGTSYMLYLNENTGIDYGIYQNGTALNKLGGNTAIGAVDPVATRFLYVGDTAFSTTEAMYGIASQIFKTAGATDASDDMFTTLTWGRFNQNGGTMGDLYALWSGADLFDGTLTDIAGVWTRTDLDGGTVSGNAYAIYGYIDQEAGNSISGDAYVMYLGADFDGTVTGTTYMLYLAEATGVDYGIYQSGSADNYFGGNVGIKDSTPVAPLHVVGDASGGGLGYTDVHGIYIDNVNVSAGNGNYGNGIEFSPLGGTGARKASILSVQTANDSDQLGIAFITSNSGTYTDDSIEAMRIKHNGLVGIGVIVPSAMLDIANEIDVTQTLLELVDADIGGGVHTQIQFRRSASTVGDTISGYINTNSTDLYVGAADDLYLDAGGSTVMAIDSSGYVGIGLGATTPAGHLQVQDLVINTASTYIGGYFNHAKTAGVTDYNDTLYGIYNKFELNQTGGEAGYLYGIYNLVLHTDGDIGAVGNARHAFGMRNALDLDGGLITGNIYGEIIVIDQEASHTISGSSYGLYVSADYDGTTTNSTYMIYLVESSGVDYGIYQNGSAQNLFGGDILLNGTAKLRFSDSSDAFLQYNSWDSQGIILDERDESRNARFYLFSSTGVRNYIEGNSAGFSFGSTSYGHVGIGAGASYYKTLYVYNNAIDTADTYRGIEAYHVKTAGSSNYADTLSGIYSFLQYNQSGGEIGDVYGINNIFRLTLGTVGAVGNAKTVYGMYTLADLDAGEVTSNVLAGRFEIDQESGNTIDNNAYVLYAKADLDGTVSGTAYMLYLDEQTGVDYGIYQSGTADNRLGGKLGVGVDPTDVGKIHFREGDSGATINYSPTMVLEADGNCVLKILNPSTADGYILFGDEVSDQVGGLRYEHGADIIYFTSGAGFDFNRDVNLSSSADLFVDGNVGIGTATPTGHLTVQDTTVNTTDAYYGIYNYHIKTAGATDSGDNLYGIYNYAEFDQSGGTIGDLYGISNNAILDDGTVADDMFGIYNFIDLDGGGVTDDIYGIYTLIDLELGVTTGGDVYGHYIYADLTTAPTGTAYLLYLNSGNNVDYGIYQASDEDNLFGGRIRKPGTFANIYLNDGSTAQSIATGATYVKLTGFADDGESSNCTADVANDKITITKTGRYMVMCSISGGSGTANVEFKFSAFLDGVEQSQVHTTRLFSTANDVGSVSMCGIVDVDSASEDIDVRARHDNGGAVDFTPQYMSLSVHYLGET